MKQRVLADVRVEISPPPYLAQLFRGEVLAKETEKWARDFEEFVQDHRSQDLVNVYVVRDYANICSFCHSEWEEDAEGWPICCNNAVKEHEIKRAKEAVTDNGQM